MNKLVEIVVLSAVLAVGVFPTGIHGDFFEHAEPSQHVMHIRKLTDSDKLRIELEPVWFHLESTDQSVPSESQQVKRQVDSDIRRPVEVYPSVDELSRQQRKRARGSRSEYSLKSDSADSFLQHFWQVEPTPNRLQEGGKDQLNSLEEKLENVNLPDCFRQYLHEVYDRNNRSVRKLMRCLAQQPEESCRGAAAARRTQRYLPQHSASKENSPEVEEYNGKPERKVARKQKNQVRVESSEENSSADEELKFEQLFIRSDRDDGPHVFEPAEEDLDSSESEGLTVESSRSDETKSGGAERQSRESESKESQERLYTPDGRLRPVPYRRMPQKYNMRRRQSSSSDESKQDCSGEECDGSWEYY